MCRKGLKDNADKMKGMLLGGEEGLECQICIDRVQLDIAYLGYVLDELGIYVAEHHKKVANVRKVVGAISFLVNSRGLQHEYVRVLHEALFVSVLL